MVQVAGLQRWLTLVPVISRDALDPSRSISAEQRFEFWHTVLCTGIAETAGYTLIDLFTVLAVVALRPSSLLPRWLAVAGLIAAGRITTRSGPPRRGGQPHQLRRVHPLVCLAARRRRRAPPVPTNQIHQGD